MSAPGSHALKRESVGPEEDERPILEAITLKVWDWQKQSFVWAKGGRRVDPQREGAKKMPLSSHHGDHGNSAL